MALMKRQYLEEYLTSVGYVLKETQDDWDIWTDATGTRFEYVPQHIPILFAYATTMIHRIDAQTKADA